ncbi:LPS assembly lipoprotein LptE [Rudanella paleaurantiibacter]|nr:LptE family protein [Rudanella paleaurantiibacter]
MKLMKNNGQVSSSSKQWAVKVGRVGVRIAAYFYCLLLLTSCGVYSFTGTTLSPDLKTITINNFSLQTAGGPTNLSLNFNERLKEYYQRYTNLKVVPNNGDLVLDGSITNYDLLAVAPTASDQAGLNRLQITVQARFVNNKDESKNFEQSFSFYQDFPQNQTLTQNEARLVPRILDQLVLDIFNKTAADW